MIEPIPAELTDTVTTILDTFIDAKQRQLAPIGPELDQLVDAARRAVHGGKRLRPAFAYWGWRAAGGGVHDAEALLTAAAAIELVHASALAHDDVMDDSETRRGQPAAHRGFSERLQSATTGRADAERFGRSAAILLGDLLLSWSDEMLGTSGFEPATIVRGRVYFDKLRSEVVAGQFLDVLAQTRDTSSASEALRVVRYKSAKYTVERPLQFGAALAKADTELLDALSSYGVPLGEAFQLRDDVLGVFGEPRVTGKPSGDDIREGKRTLLVARAFDNASRAQRAVLDRYFATPEVDADGVAAVQQVIRDTGALAAVETVIAELTAASEVALADAPIADAEARAALGVLVDRVTNRTV